MLVIHLSDGHASKVYHIFKYGLFFHISSEDNSIIEHWNIACLFSTKQVLGRNNASSTNVVNGETRNSKLRPSWYRRYVNEMYHFSIRQ
jgi:hypothetical protein